MKKFWAVPLLVITMLFAGCPTAENNARDAIAADKAFVDSVARAHGECNNPETRTTASVCVLVDRANAVKHLAGEALNLYCASPDYDTVPDAKCSPPLDKTQKNQLQNKLAAALRDLSQIIADIKALAPSTAPTPATP